MLIMFNLKFFLFVQQGSILMILGHRRQQSRNSFININFSTYGSLGNLFFKIITCFWIEIKALMFKSQYF